MKFLLTGGAGEAEREAEAAEGRRSSTAASAFETPSSSCLGVLAARRQRQRPRSPPKPTTAKGKRNGNAAGCATCACCTWPSSRSLRVTPPSRSPPRTSSSPRRRTPLMITGKRFAAAAAWPTPPRPDFGCRFLAHLYAAEALCMLNRPADAAQHLSPTILKDNISQSANVGPSAARYSMYINLAIVHILQVRSLLPFALRNNNGTNRRAG